MRRPFSFLFVLFAAGCGGPQETAETQRDASVQQFEVSEEAAPPSGPAADSRASVAGGPNVGPTAAPGVAFNYRYAFRLPAERIAQVQEQHAPVGEAGTVGGQLIAHPGQHGYGGLAVGCLAE